MLGSPSRVRLLRVLTQAASPLTGREVERRAGVAHRAAVRALGQLVEAAVVVVARGATAHAYRLSPKHPLSKRLTRLFDREAAMRSR
jgi:DNA-binding transcriptional ArsR family regulator